MFLWSRVTLCKNTQTNNNSLFLPVSSDGHTFIHAICGAGDDVVQLVGHSAGARHVCNAARAIQFGSQDVVQHAACVADLKTARLDATDLGDRK